MSIEIAIRSLEEQVEPLERLLRLFTASLERPVLVQSDESQHFRFEEPDLRHFCLLKAAKVLSTLHASFELARKGYTQEIAVLIRTLVECTSHIEFMINEDESEEHQKAVEKYVNGFFADSQRTPNRQAHRMLVTQGAVHSQLGKTLDSIAAQMGGEAARVPAKERYANIYRVYSNYVHANYPECMDLYGANPGFFHVRGFDGTPKLGEGLEMLQVFVGTVTNTFVLMIQRLDMKRFVEADPVIAMWYRNFFSRSVQ